MCNVYVFYLLGTTVTIMKYNNHRVVLVIILKFNVAKTDDLMWHQEKKTISLVVVLSNRLFIIHVHIASHQSIRHTTYVF